MDFINAIAVAVIVVSLVWMGMSIYSWYGVDPYDSVTTNVDALYARRVLKILCVIIFAALWLIFG